MAGSPVSPLQTGEPVTTREEMDFDDNEHEQETGRVSPNGRETIAPVVPAKSPSPRPKVSFQEGHEEILPDKPPRPVNPQQQAENTLTEAFPSIDAKVVKAVLMASGGKVEPAFNALLGMTDPESAAQEQPAAPPQPPRPALRQPRNQMEADELYARQLAEQFNASPPRGAHAYNQREPGRRGPNQQPQQYHDGEPERSFFDDDLPEIGRNIQQGFQETQKRFNSWITNFRKKLDGEDEDEDLYNSSQPGSRSNSDRWTTTRQNFGGSQADQLRGIRRSAEANHNSSNAAGGPPPRRSTEAQRYDADPHELDDDAFERLELRDEEAPPPMPPRTSSRQPANPNLFKSQPAVPGSNMSGSTGVRPPQSGPVDEVDAADRLNSSLRGGAGATSGGEDAGKAKKWQPLTSIDPQAEDDNDPFSVGDDEEDVTPSTNPATAINTTTANNNSGKGGVDDKSEDVRKEDTERLKAAAATTTTTSTTSSMGKTLEEAPRKGSINAEAEALLNK